MEIACVALTTLEEIAVAARITTSMILEMDFANVSSTNTYNTLENNYSYIALYCACTYSSTFLNISVICTSTAVSCTVNGCTACESGYSGPDCCSCASGHHRNPTTLECQGIHSHIQNTE